MTASPSLAASFRLSALRLPAALEVLALRPLSILSRVWPSTTCRKGCAKAVQSGNHVATSQTC